MSSGTATWEDRLTIANPDVIVGLPRFNEVVAYFFPEAHGGVDHGNAFFQASIQLPDGTLVSDSASSNDANPFERPDMFLALKAPAELLLPFGGIFAGLAFRMDLSVETSNTILPGQIANVDYSHTAILPAVFFGDANGNPIPELAGLRLVGASGMEYPVTVVPEPSAAWLTLAGMAGALRFMARRRRNARNSEDGALISPGSTS